MEVGVIPFEHYAAWSLYTPNYDIVYAFSNSIEDLSKCVSESGECKIFINDNPWANEEKLSKEFSPMI